MSGSHEINKLEFQIEGYSDEEIKQIVNEVLIEVIEKYFDKFDIPDKLILIDKIHFDLGSIRMENFREELTVRLSYLLQTELKSFFEQPNLQEQLDEKIVISNNNAFLNYIQKGYSKLESQSLNELFENLLQTNISLLKAFMGEIRYSPSARKRLLYQVSLDKLELYWSKVYFNEFKLVKAIESQILTDAGEMHLKVYSQNTVSSLLRRLTFDFMMDEVGDQVQLKYLEKLKSHIEEFKAFEHSFKKSTFQYFEDLSQKVLTRSSIEKPNDSKEFKEADVISDYIIHGKSPSEFSKIVIGRAREIDVQQLDEVIERIAERDIKIQQYNRLLSIFSRPQVERIIDRIAQLEGGYLEFRLKEIAYLKTIIRELFNEDLFFLGRQELFQILISTSSNKKQRSFIKNVIEALSAKKSISKGTISNSLRSRIGKSGHREARAINNIIDQLIPELEQEEKFEKSRPTDQMTVFIHYLTSGVWLFEDKTPQEVLKKLLEESPEHLTLELTRHIGKQTVWLRLVYQFPINILKNLFETVFAEDENLTLLLRKLRVFSNNALG